MLALSLCIIEGKAWRHNDYNHNLTPFLPRFSLWRALNVIKALLIEIIIIFLSVLILSVFMFVSYPESSFLAFLIVAVECGFLVMPMNGSSYGDLTTYPNKVSFQCDEGFTLKGSSLRTCMANGSWSGNNASCEGASLAVRG